MEICAPFAGIVHYHVAVGDTVATGEPVATVEAVKLEVPVPAPGPGVVTALGYEDFADVVGGDVLAVVAK
ncbi:acetyl-CoA carboxylase biotin carboxyl carrier protein subunit [Corynebacterium guangdongense]|uniref:Biotin carboxyl carrier protein n=1 Tax=Corynebacterium guangdongense TaxID=1783348 RepID=A0ABU1ZWE1_9CORY|nr:acetyl-CoA carboxylase biotin carboxyl carrier protein subunit [Corynebacterium guangdongense]MDR7329220.1 biotin carboxyl carrier protein [Corynebacterium guangdongense]WJZ17786.1 Biotin/lipoyl attachment protein [Corynebacterium guangdongense]